MENFIFCVIQPKIFLPKSGIRKDVAVSVNNGIITLNTESLNKSNSKNAFLKF